ncbi:MAG: YeeE/YedE thiosulfate transporter family protein [Bacteroidales bacterium]|nr:YeeE/YedE thiosulfate transporter family protein [Bacteroidales bacterium]MDT8431688.1 YeeE/YedE thiosulfate transporter family protein [Bacteroidales bacterium]
MGPLISYDIISQNSNFLFAFLIGIGFGFVLEASGFSSSRKLAGVFYGYDTVVLKVFFTAAITGMIGLLFLSLFNWINLDLVYIKPTFLYSTIAGGIIMGAGFIIGGFCPGTSFCAASIGKIDAMFFIGGMLVGVLIFAEAFPLLEDFYYAKNLGIPTLSEKLGLKDGVVVLGIIIVAMGMFWAGEWAEKKFPREEY